VVDRPRRAEAQRPGPDAVGRQAAHGLDLLGGGHRLVVRPPVAHHVAPQRRVGHLGGDVERMGQALDHVEVLGEALPAPADAFGQGRAGDVLHALHQSDEPVVAVGLHRSEADAAVAHHDRGHALPGRRGQQRVPGDLAVVVGVDVDPARGDQQPFGVELLAPRARHVTHGGDAAVVDGDVGHPAIRTGPVDHGPAPDDQIVLVCPHGPRVRPGPESFSRTGCPRR